MIGLEYGEAFLEDGELAIHRLVVHAGELFVDLLDARLEDGHVAEEELGLEGGDVAQRVDAAVGVRDGVVAKEADDLDQRIIRLHGREKAGGELGLPVAPLCQAAHYNDPTRAVT